MRVTQQSLYGNVLSQTNASLLSVVQTNEQMSTQKRINKPSDDASGTVEVLNTRSVISKLTQYGSNIKSATAWLGQADSTLTSVSTLITSIKTEAEQAATGSVTADNREQIATAVRQYFEQLITLSNTQYGNSYIFSGQKTDTPAFVESLSMNSNDTTFDAAVASGGGFSIVGDSASTVLVQFMASGAGSVTQPAFSYSTDGGDSWNTGTYATASSAGTQVLNLGGGLTISMASSALTTVKGSANHDDTNGTWMWIRPTAIYQGNSNDDVNVVSTGNTNVTASAAGTFSDTVMVRADSDCSFASGETFNYSYSIDGGKNWVTDNTATADGTSVAISVPGGMLTLSDNGGGIVAGNQFFIQPSTADISVAISDTDSVAVNGVGKDIFGGIYNGKAVTFNGSNGGNLIETVGKLVGFLETNNQSGIQQCLDNLTTSQNNVLTAAASVGAKENRLTLASNTVENLASTADTTLSNVEDADLTELITKLAQQELAYQAVLKTSSTVMGLSLLNYI
jgi:flagellar hook-associated protein 3 FlgL